LRDTPARVTWLMACVAVALLGLSGQLYRLTVAESATYQVVAEQNIERHLPSFAPRGTIVDRNGRTLATSAPAFAAVLLKQDEETVAEVLPRLADVLARGDSQKAAEIVERVTRQVRINRESGRQFEPLTVERNLDEAMVTLLTERRSEFPGVAVVEEPARVYPNGKVAAAVIGYVGHITHELEMPGFEDYNPNEIVGKAGLEQYYEKDLRGQPGRNSVIVDPLGRPVSGYTRTPPVPGNTLVTTLDLELQRVAEEVLARQMEWLRNERGARPTRAALVVLEVKTGAILAMVSIPTYDPNMMARGLTEEEWAELQNQPGVMVNWALQGFAPGSTFKMATGIAGLLTGVVGPYEYIDCPARYWRYGNPKNWTSYDQGPADLARALAISCNPYFFELGHRMGLDAMHAIYDQLGFGKPTGVDLPDESPGVNPSIESYGDRWQPGNVINVAIGQGDVLVTPLQLANYTAAIASGGVLRRPYLVSEVRSPTGEVLRRREPEVIGVVDAPPEVWQRVQQGMRQAVTSPEGTAYAAFYGFPVAVAAKTGSAETGREFAHALTVAYAPYEDPEIAVSVIVEGGSTGSWVAPVVRRVMAHYFGIQEELPAIVPTYR